MSSSIVVQCKIKLNIVLRLGKELAAYRNELDAQKRKIEKMAENQADVYDVKKQKEVLHETQIMIPDTMRRLDNAIEDLEVFLDSSKNVLLEESVYADALKVLEEAKSATDIRD